MCSLPRNGIIAGGNWIVDYIKLIDTYPSENALANILGEKMDTGGAPCNVLKALRKMQVDFPLEGIGLVGDDEAGRELLRVCENYGIESQQIRTLHGKGTSYTDVMTVASTGKRTFFHHRGASAHLDISDFDFSTTRAKFFHLGYLLLLDQLDHVDETGRSGASRVLEAAQQNGLITSVDLVSEQSDRYMSIVASSLNFIDILFLNEFEVERLTGVSLLNQNGNVVLSQAQEAARRILQKGVRRWVIIHFPLGALAFNPHGEYWLQHSIHVDEVRGTVGAGDAFAAGVLGALHNDWPIQESLQSGVCVAATSLRAAGASEGIMPWGDCLDFGKSQGFHENSIIKT